MSENKVFIIVTETVWQSWARDAGTLALFVGLIGIGVFLHSSALQWVGALIAFLGIFARSSGLHKPMTRDQAIKALTDRTI